METQQVSKKTDFSGESIYVGIDVHKKQWNVSIMSSFKEHKTFVQPPDPRVLGNYLKEHFPNASYKSVYEAGFCGFWIDDALKKNGIQNIIVNPSDVPTSDKEKKQKTDRVDSRKLCKTLRDNSLTGIYIPPQGQLEDRGAVRLRKKLVGDITRCKNRIKSMLNFYGIKVPDELDSNYWSKALVSWLQTLKLSHSSGNLSLQVLVEEMLAIQKLKKHVERHLVKLAQEKYRRQVDLLKNIRGIALTAALTFITELGDIKRFNDFDGLCNYAGLVPNIYSSGDTKYIGSLTNRKNIYLQPMLIQCAWKAASKDPVLLIAYQNWRKRMSAKKAIIRVARKLLRRIQYVMSNEKI
jgi:transposase